MNVEKLKRLQAQVRIGGKGTPRRKKKVVHQTAATDDKKLQSSLKKLSVSTIPGIEEVNIIKDDLSVIHFNNPKAQASLSANTFAITGHGENKKVVEMLPEILPQLGQETVMQLRRFANNLSVSKNLTSVTEEDDVPTLVQDFDEASKNEVPLQTSLVVDGSSPNVKTIGTTLTEIQAAKPGEPPKENKAEKTDEKTDKSRGNKKSQESKKEQKPQKDNSKGKDSVEKQSTINASVETLKDHADHTKSKLHKASVTGKEKVINNDNKSKLHDEKKNKDDKIVESLKDNQSIIIKKVVEEPKLSLSETATAVMPVKLETKEKTQIVALSDKTVEISKLIDSNTVKQKKTTSKVEVVDGSKSNLQKTAELSQGNNTVVAVDAKPMESTKEAELERENILKQANTNVLVANPKEPINAPHQSKEENKLSESNISVVELKQSEPTTALKKAKQDKKLAPDTPIIVEAKPSEPNKELKLSNQMDKLFQANKVVGDATPKISTKAPEQFKLEEKLPQSNITILEANLTNIDISQAQIVEGNLVETVQLNKEPTPIGITQKLEMAKAVITQSSLPTEKDEDMSTPKLGENLKQVNELKTKQVNELDSTKHVQSTLSKTKEIQQQPILNPIIVSDTKNESIKTHVNIKYVDVIKPIVGDCLLATASQKQLDLATTKLTEGSQLSNVSVSAVAQPNEEHQKKDDTKHIDNKTEAIAIVFPKDLETKGDSKQKIQSKSTLATQIGPTKLEDNTQHKNLISAKKTDSTKQSLPSKQVTPKQSSPSKQIKPVSPPQPKQNFVKPLQTEKQSPPKQQSLKTNTPKVPPAQKQTSPKPQQPQPPRPQSAGTTPKMEKTPSQPTQQKQPSPKPQQAAPKPQQPSPKPQQPSPKPQQSSPKPQQSSPKPQQQSPNPQQPTSQAASKPQIQPQQKQPKAQQTAQNQPKKN